jgi:hypothetical protein
MHREKMPEVMARVPRRDFSVAAMAAHGQAVKPSPGQWELKNMDFFLSEGFQDCAITFLSVAIRLSPGLCRVILP